MSMPDWQLRVIDEKTELDKKIVKLFEFINSDAFVVLSANDQSLLRTQYELMGRYSHILHERIRGSA